MPTTKEVMDAVETLSETLDKNTLALSSLSEAIRNREITRIQESLRTDSDDKEAISKWFTHYENGDEVESEVEAVEAKTEDGNIKYVIVASEMHSRKKSRTGDNGTYHARWIIGEDDSTAQNLFIHRLEWRQSFESSLSKIEDPLETTKQWLGFDDYLPTDPSGIEPGLWYQAQGDIALRFKPYNRHLESQAQSQANTEITEKKESVFKEWKAAETRGITETDSINVYLSHSRISVNISVSTTDDLKTLQEDLGFTETTVRDNMDNSWSRLTAKRRKEVLTQLVRDRIKRYLNSRIPDKSELTKSIQDEIRETERENTTQQNILIGNHLIVCDQGIRTRSQRGVEATVVIPTESEVTLLHDEHSNHNFSISEYVMEVKVLNRHQQS
jgi:hypothetical protein